jgi:hypothetical protein
VPAETLDATLRAVRPSLVISAAQRLQTAAGLSEMGRQVAQAGLPLAYGGMIFALMPELCERIPGRYLGNRLDEAPEAVGELMARLPGASQVPPVDAALLRARDHFLHRQPLIDLEVGQVMEQYGLSGETLQRANRELGRGIAAALALGNLQFLGGDLEWLAGLLRNHGLPPAALAAYLRAYEAAARARLGEAGAAIVDWLGGISGGRSL